MTNIHVDVAYKSLNKKGEELCGDKVEIARTPDSVIMVLADGLGSGVKANILSTLTSKIIITMLVEGSSIEDAVETIANTLPICEVRKLAYSTFSILQIYNDGRAYLVEFDNPTCVFVRDSALVDLPFEYREIAQKNVRECRFEVRVGDVLTLMSDGVIHAGVGALLNLGFKWENVAAHMLGTVTPDMTAARLTASLSQVCDSLYMGKPGDDTTVLTARIMPRKVVNLFSGPPQKKEDDERLVRDFMREPGKHIVCGGTGGNIVSRVLNRPLKVSLGDYVDTGIPPIAYLQGIDLVTEGVLTISKTIDLIKQQVENDMDDSYFKGLDAKNGAAMLARMLLEECTTLNLFIGKAINPAHQNPNLPLDLSIKLRLLDELAELLEKLGKKVEKRYY